MRVWGRNGQLVAEKAMQSGPLCSSKMWSCVPGEIGSHWGILKKFLTRVDLFKNTYGYYMEEGLTGGQPERSLSQESVWEVVLCVLQSCEVLGTNWPELWGLGDKLTRLFVSDKMEARKGRARRWYSGSAFSNWVHCGAFDLRLGRLKTWRTITNSTLDWICSVWKMSK